MTACHEAKSEKACYGRFLMNNIKYDFWKTAVFPSPATPTLIQFETLPLIMGSSGRLHHSTPITYMTKIKTLLHTPIGKKITELILTMRALPLLGRRFHCPCCGWSLRHFTVGGASLKSKPNGYCPRCNSKPRHRWLWIFLQEKTELFKSPLRVLHLSPAYSMGRSMAALHHLSYTSADLVTKQNVHIRMDLSDAAFKHQSFDAIVCLHVLEHVERDRPAIDNLYRMVKPGGWVLVGVPIRLDENTYEDASIVDPEARKAAFGEKDHYRWYGRDLIDRLSQTGFEVEMHKACDFPISKQKKYGLKSGEVMLLCRRCD